MDRIRFDHFRKFLRIYMAKTIDVQGTAITVISVNNEDYISLTDMLKAKDGDFFISDWLSLNNS